MNTTAPTPQQQLAGLNAAETAYMRLHWDNGGSSEFDQSINDISRAKIKVFKKIHGKVFLSKVNHYDNEPEGIMVEYTGQKVWNFEYDIITVYDQKLADLIREYREKSLRDIYMAAEKIYARVGEIHGEVLQWS